MGKEEFIALRCADDALALLGANLTGFAPAGGAPDWLVSGAWLSTGEDAFLATGAIEVLSDGYLARPLQIDRPADLAARIDAELPDVRDRLLARGSDLDLPDAAVPSVPAALSPWSDGGYAMSILARIASRPTTISRVACALLFEARDGASLLVGTDVSTLAIVLSQDSSLIERYRQDCEELTVEQYQAARGS